MRLSIVKNVGLLVLAVVGIASRADAGIITVPPGLAPGSQYRLVFETTETYNAESTSISTYNMEVDAAAGAVVALDALGTTWRDIGSTASENAINNIGINPGVPIYDLGGHLIATDAGTGAGGLFSGTLQYPPCTAEDGTCTLVFAWTGSDSIGNTAPGNGLGTSEPEYGATGKTDAYWIAYGIGGSDDMQALYGISGILTVPSATPEPATTGMVIAAGALMFFAGRRNHRPL
jgi:hypothetical protein